MPGIRQSMKTTSYGSVASCRLDGGDGLLARGDGIDRLSDAAEQRPARISRAAALSSTTRTRSVCKRARVRPAESAARRAHPEPDREVERAADARLALDPDLAAHQLDQPAADRQAQAGAAVLARRGHVGLGERLEQLRRLLRRHADAGVAHRELELAPSRRSARPARR